MCITPFHTSDQSMDFEHSVNRTTTTTKHCITSGIPRRSLVAVATATALREKEAAVFAKESGDFKTNIAAMKKAIELITSGMEGGAFLQTCQGALLKKFSIDIDMSSADRDVLTSFLSRAQRSDYAPKSGEIVGILKQMTDTMEGDLANITATEVFSNESIAIGIRNSCI